MQIVDFVKRGASYVARRAAGTLRRAYAYLWHESRGHGRPKSKEKWDTQYRTGFWDRLESTSELSRYMVILGYISSFSKTPSILDVGCGNGRLARLLLDFSVAFESYTGIDLSSEAVSAIDLEPRQRLSFEAADFDDWHTSRAFDVIVFNETLYYARFPDKTLARYLPFLSDQGVVIVSMCRSSSRHLMWRKLEDLLEFPARTTLTNESGSVWDVRLGFPHGHRHRPVS